jgi:nucleoside-diphosphate-sugar epimerase
LQLVIMRPGVIYGQGRESLTGRVGLRSGRLVITTAGKQPLPYTHVENCAAAIRLAGDVEGIAGHAFNVVDDDVPSARAVLRAYRRAGRRLTVVRVPYFLLRRLGAWNQWYHHWSTGQLPAVLTPYKVASMWKPLRYANARAKQVLGWKPEVGWSNSAAESIGAA